MKQLLFISQSLVFLYDHLSLFSFSICRTKCHSIVLYSHKSELIDSVKHICLCSPLFPHQPGLYPGHHMFSVLHSDSFQNGILGLSDGQLFQRFVGIWRLTYIDLQVLYFKMYFPIGIVPLKQCLSPYYISSLCILSPL